MITQERLKELFYYDEDTGIFIRKTAISQTKIGDIAGWIDNYGYKLINIDNRKYKCHRLAWFYKYGKWPSGFIDHIDGTRSNNAILNLRETNNAGNLQNRKSANCNNKCGYLGVDLHKGTGKYRARISTNKIIKNLGLFFTPKEAHQAYLLAKRELHLTCTI